MTYRLPGVVVAQEFTDLQPALAPYRFTNCTVGPAFQIVPADIVGSYTGVPEDYTYTAMTPGNIVDLRLADPTLLASEQYPIEVALTNITVEYLPSVSTGYVNATDLLEFNDDTPDVFSTLVPGDTLIISSQSSVVLPSGTIGTTSADDVMALSDGNVSVSIVFKADVMGIAGNSIILTFDGVKTLSAVMAAWNDINPSNTVSNTGGSLTSIYQAGIVGLVGGSSGTFASTNVSMSSHAFDSMPYDVVATASTSYSMKALTTFTYDSVAVSTSTYSKAAAETEVVTGVTFTADTLGPIGDSIALVFDGIEDVDTVTAAWNLANPGNTVTHDGVGTEVPTAQTVTLTGGVSAVPVDFKAVSAGPAGNSLTLVFDGSTTIDASITAQAAGQIVHNGDGDGIAPAGTITFTGGATAVTKTITAVDAGTTANSISFSSGGGYTTLQDDLLTWNTANPLNTATISAAANDVISVATVVTLTGGTANTSTAIFTADNTGPDGNNIALVFDGVQDLATVVNTWNTANPTNTVTQTGQGIGVKTMPMTLTLSGGGSDVPANFIATTSGPLGNSISLQFNGVDDITTVLNTWNAANPTNTVMIAPGVPVSMVFPGSLRILQSGTPGQFTPVQVGQTVVIQSGTDCTPGSYLVTDKISNDALELASDFYTGTVPVFDVMFEVTQVVSQPSPNNFVVRSVMTPNKLLMQRAYTGSPGSGISYTVNRVLAESTLTRNTDYTATETEISLIGGLTVSGSKVLSSSVAARYRALNVSLSGSVQVYETIADLEATFGVGQIVPENPLAYGMFISIQNSATAAQGIGLAADYYTDEVLAYAKAFENVERSDSYITIPLTNNTAVASLLKTHVTSLSDEGQGRERTGAVSRTLVTVETVVDTSITSGSRVIVNTTLNGIATDLASTLGASSPIFSNVQVGDQVTITAGTGVIPGTYSVSAKNSDTQLQLGNSFVASASSNDVQFFIMRPDGIDATGSLFYDSTASYITDGVTVGQFVLIEAQPAMPYPPTVTVTGRHRITAVISDTAVQIVQIPGVSSVQGGIKYSIEKDMSKTEQAEFIADYAASIGSRRMVFVWPDVIKVLKGSTEVDVPGFFSGCALGGMTTGLPPQQGFTNLSVSGIQGLIHSSDYFTDTQLNIMANKGVMILTQLTSESIPYIRHELTTDRSSVKFQEFMITKNVDFSAKLMQSYFASFPGKYNVVDSTYDELKSISGAMITYLKDETFLKGLGGIIRSGRLVEMKEGSSIDTIRMRFKMDYPIPLNNIDIVIEA